MREEVGRRCDVSKRGVSSRDARPASGRAPVRRPRWSGVLQATGYGQICPQTGGLLSNSLLEGEDCLNLNIWTPDPSARDLPVMVWAHGGGQISGSGANELYDGGHFAREGVVLVTCNRRLGAEGFLYLEELFGDGIGLWTNRSLPALLLRLVRVRMQTLSARGRSAGCSGGLSGCTRCSQRPTR